MHIWKKILLLLIFPVFCCLAAEPEMLLKMELSTVLPEGWLVNPTVSKTATVALQKDEENVVFLRADGGWLHYYNPALFAVSPTDTIIVRVTARGKGIISIGPYTFSEGSGKFRGALKQPLQLTSDWQTHEYKLQLPQNTDAKTGQSIYLERVRPLIELSGGKEYDFKDYTLEVVRNALLTPWRVEHHASHGTFYDKDGVLKIDGHCAFKQPDLEKVVVGDTLQFTFLARGKGHLIAGCRLYDLQYRPTRKDDTHCAEIIKEHALDTAEWKTVSLAVAVDNVRNAEGKIRFVNRAQAIFNLSGEKHQLEIKDIAYQKIAEKLEMPDF